MPYPASDKRSTSDRRCARQAALLLGAGVLTAGAVFVVAGVALHNVDFNLLRIETPELGELPQGLGEPGWRQLRSVDVQTGQTYWTRSLDPAVAAVLTELQPARAIDARTRVVKSAQSVRAEDVTTQRVRWSAELHRPVFGLGPVAGPAVGVVVLGGEPAAGLTETLFLDVATGLELWRTPSGALSSFAYDPMTGTLYEYGEGRVLLARDPRDGTVRWQVDRPYGRLFAYTGTVWVAGGGRLTAYDGATGATRSDTAITGSTSDALPVAVAGTTAVIAEP